MEPTYVIIIIVAAMVLLLFILIAPGNAGDRKKPFTGRNIAHRGLYSEDQSIPENSLPAFARGADLGYGVELDVQLTRDGQVVVFHDNTLERMCGVPQRIDELDLAKLRELRLCNTEERIPLFSDVLETVSGRVPIIVELKNVPQNRELCEKTLALIESYEGEICVESFNPKNVAFFARRAPRLFRGQLAQPLKYYTADGLSVFTGFLLSNLLFNVVSRPHFIAYMIGGKPLSLRICEALGAVTAVWTSHDRTAESLYDIVIFEHYEPETRFK